MTVLPSSVPSTRAPVRPEIRHVFGHTTKLIHQAATALWPGQPVTLDQHVPSVTSYVHRIRVGQHLLYAKVPYLGVSLASLLRGACGGWPAISHAQEAYAESPSNLALREASQLRFLATLGRPQVCRLAGVHDGVLFTSPVIGPTLTDLLLARPGDAADLLARPLHELRPLHQPQTPYRLELSSEIGERGIADTFLRKFSDARGATYMDHFGAERCEAEQRKEILERLRRTVGRLHKLSGTVPPVTRGVLVYGDLKPEHILFPHGTNAAPVLLDPGLSRAGSAADLAKLLSRTVLVLAARQPRPRTMEKVMAGITALVESRTWWMSRQARRSWSQAVLVLLVELSVAYRDGWLGIPLRFQRGRPSPCLPALDATETRQFEAAHAKLHAAYQALRSESPDSLQLRNP